MSAPRFDAAELARVPDELLARYDVAGPRYTSYPTAPVWSDDFGAGDYRAALADSASSGRPLSLYVHVPFCEALCLYCGCSVVITKQRERSERYVDRVERELATVADAAGAGGRETVQVAWGGGTPTYLPPETLRRLAAACRSAFPVADDAEVAIEVDPRVTTPEHVEAVAASGFNRISMGVQDFDHAVQREIRRVQSFEMTRDLVAGCRAAGIDSVNLDLVYGLPRQTFAGFDATIDRVLELSPDRVSAFSYAHVPWLKPAQRAFDEATLPRGREKFDVFVHLIARLTDAGYVFVGMDHFAKPGNELASAQESGALWRNFQGFTTKAGTDLVGTGVTSIGSVAGRFAQNEKDLAEWSRRVDDGELPTRRGMTLTADDRLRADVIQDVMCRYEFDPARTSARHGVDAGELLSEAVARLEPLELDGMIERTPNGGFVLTSLGRVFVRNVCMPFDAHLRTDGRRPVFSRTV